MSKSDQGVYVCHACVGDDFLKKEIRSDGDAETCTFCGKHRKAYSLEVLADCIHDVFQEHFYLTPSEPSGIDYALAKEGLWERSGELVEYVIANIAQLDEEIAKKFRNICPNNMVMGR